VISPLPHTTTNPL